MQYADIKGQAELLKTSTGEALDALVALLGLTRQESKKATAKERFLLAEARADTVAVPAGTRVKTQGGRYFNTLDYAEIPPGATYVDTIVQAEEAGAESSGILAGEINILVDPIPYIASVSNVDESTGGLDVEDDDSLTERAYLAPSRFSCAGPRDAYEYHVRDWRSDVTDVQITSPAPCEIAIYFVMEGGRLPNATEREELTEYISGENLRPLCDKVVCVEPEEVAYTIEKWLKMGMKPREVADKLRVHVSTIYRELKRGAYDRLDGGTWEVKTAYSPDIAEEKYQAHLREKGPDLKIGNDHELANYIETTILDKDCSPAAVLGFAMIEGKKFKTSLSVPTIYKYIAKGLFLNLTQEELPRHGKKKHKYKKVKKNKSASRAPAGESIEQRPEEIDGREEFGHWEGDTVYSGKGKRKTTRALLTLTERKTRKEIIIAIPNRKAETVVKALDALERKLGARRFRAIFKSITFDNGTEFAAAEELERSCINKHLPRTKVYFCHPYSSWERGTNENTNGMIRRRFPKGTNFAAVTNAQIVQVESWINNYPRKILGYKSSEIVFRECLRELGIAA